MTHRQYIIIYIYIYIHVYIYIYIYVYIYMYNLCIYNETKHITNENIKYMKKVLTILITIGLQGIDDSGPTSTTQTRPIDAISLHSVAHDTSPSGAPSD